MMPRTRKARDTAPCLLREGKQRRLRLHPDTARAVDMHWVETREQLSVLVDKLIRRHFKLPPTGS
jgi:hypothetical protein